MKNIFLLITIFVFYISLSAQNENTPELTVPKTLYMVSNAHLDTQWDWDIQTTINEYLKNTLVDNFALFKKYPEYKFNFEGAIKYMWFKQYYPDLYPQLKTYIASGRWNICGSSLDANDVNVPSPESLIRNILIGQTYYKKEFGKKSNDIFLPDCFGFGYVVPTIANHCGLIGFSTQKLRWGAPVIPFRIGAWQGVDGSKILAAVEGGNYVQNFSENLSNRSEFINWANETGTATGGKHYIAFRYYGTGDRGGAPQDATVDWLTKSIVSPTGALTVKSALAGEIFTDYSQYINDFPQYNGELLLTTHGTGCYTSRTMLKRWNRKNELLADAAERSSVIAEWLGGIKYPATELNDAWIKVIWHQFHDDLTGTSIPRAYTFSDNDAIICQNKFASVLKNAVGACVRSLNTQTEGTPIVVYNPLSISREDVVEVNLKVSAKPGYMQVYNKSGVKVPTQIITSTDSTVKFVFSATVKSLGYEVYDARVSASAPAKDDNLKITANSLENSVYRVSINTNGDIMSIIDKQNANKELLSGPIRLALFDNPSPDKPSWRILYSTINTNPVGYVDGTPIVTIEEQGPVRITLKISRKKSNSTFVQYIRLTNSDTQKRIDIVNDVEWKTLGTLLKAVFPLSVENPNATYDLGLGVIKRPNNTSSKYEVPAQQWADISDVNNNYGVSILNDCKYGWDKPTNNTLRLSLIHTPSVTTKYIYQKTQDLGNNKFTYSIYGHANNCMEAASTWEAAKLNQPLIAFEAIKHDGNQGKSFSMLNIESSQIALKTFKKAENGNNYVLRFYETKGTAATNIKVKFATKILNAKELNGIEEEIGNATFADSTLTLNMTAFQPKTFSVSLAATEIALTKPDCKPLILPFNADVITTQTTMTDGNFDGQTNSYSAELLPDTIIADGINFVIGSKLTGVKNAIKCTGEKITIPSGYKKLYLLAASVDTKGSEANFNINPKIYQLNIPYFSNFIGQSSVYSVTDTTLTPNFMKYENIAWSGDHFHNGSTQTDKAYQFTYLFKYCLEIPDGTNELILPNNSNIVVFAVTAANNQNDDTKPASEIMELLKPDLIAPKTTNVNDLNLKDALKISIFPNPVTSKTLNIEFTGFNAEKEIDISISDSIGKKVYQTKTKSIGKSFLTLKHNLRGGVYFITINGEKATVTAKFIVKN